MPSRNIIKEYVEDGIYHVYNRGINKQDIFLDKRDYATFLYFLKQYLLSEEKLKLIEGPSLNKLTRGRRNFSDEIELLSYCLMPNHFHLMIKQKGRRDMSEFLRCLLTNYSMYFNSRYKRIGTIFQGRYKAILVKDDNYLLHLSRYIHMNPKELIEGRTLNRLLEYEWSSYAEYLGKRDTEWVKPKLILDYFEENRASGLIDKNSYKSFVEDYAYDSKEILGNLTLD